MQLNVPQCVEKPPVTKNDLVSNVTGTEAKEPGSGLPRCRPAGQATEAGARSKGRCFIYKRSSKGEIQQETQRGPSRHRNIIQP